MTMPAHIPDAHIPLLGISVAVISKDVSICLSACGDGQRPSPTTSGKASCPSWGRMHIAMCVVPRRPTRILLKNKTRENFLSKSQRDGV